MKLNGDCSICSGKADQDFHRVGVWPNERWRLTTSAYRMVKGFCYLEPIRHIPHITDLDGKEAEEFGSVVSLAAKAIKSATGAKQVYVYIYGDHIPHLHPHLAPHVEGDIFVDDVIKSDAKLDKKMMKREELTQLSGAIGDGINSLTSGPRGA